MKWQVQWTPRALKDLKQLPPATQKRIIAAVERFAELGLGNVVLLTDVRPPEYRLRIGDWRARFCKDSAASCIQVLRVLPRDKAY